jgi:16S rRNA (guanine527-N7)-methyltransferase
LAGSALGELIDELERSQRLGFLGPGSVEVHLDHARGFAAGVSAPPARFLDLGSGGGVPGLVLATMWPDASAVLLDAGERRCAFLQEAVGRLGLDARVTVVRQRAEEAGHVPALRATFDLVVARSFGPPAVTAECGAAFLRVGGRLVVSEPPLTSHDDGDRGADPSGPEPRPSRWPADRLALLGLAPESAWYEPYSYQALLQSEPCPPRYPRRVGTLAKRPLF